MNAHVEPDAQHRAADEIGADYLARYATPVCEPIEAGRVRDYLLALDEPCEPGANQPVPPLFLLTLGRTQILRWGW